MTETTMQGPRRPRITHRWSCTQRGPYVEEISQDASGQATIVSRCLECHGDDSATPPPTTMIGRS